MQISHQTRRAAVNDRGHVIGESHHNAKLSDADVELIVALCAEGLRQTDIADKFGVSRYTVSSISQGRRRSQSVAGAKTVKARPTVAIEGLAMPKG